MAAIAIIIVACTCLLYILDIFPVGVSLNLLSGSMPDFFCQNRIVVILLEDLLLTIIEQIHREIIF